MTRRAAAPVAVPAALLAVALVAGACAANAPAPTVARTEPAPTTAAGPAAGPDGPSSAAPDPAAVAGSATGTGTSNAAAPAGTTGPPPVTTVASAGDPAATPITPTTPTTLVPPPLLAGLATDAAGLGRQLTAALRTIRDPASAPADVEAAGRRQQLVLRRLAAHPDWQAEALATVGDDVRPFATNDVTALNAPGDRTLAKPVPPAETIPAWTIRAPLPAAELLGYYREAEAATGIPWTYLAAINLVETRLGRIVGLSSANAVGPMQFLRSTWDGCCRGDPTVDRDAILGAATYLRRRGGPADMGRAVLGYNPNDAYRVMIERYAANLAADERLYLGYHAWEVFVATTAGPIRLPVGFAAAEPVPAAAYVAAHPEDRA